MFLHKLKYDSIAYIAHVQLIVVTRGAAAKSVPRLVAHPDGNSGHHIALQKSGAVTNKFFDGQFKTRRQMNVLGCV